MSWKNIETAPRDGRILQVRSDDWPDNFWVRFWTKSALEEEGWEHEPGWYEYFPESDEDGDEIVEPALWYDAIED